MPVYMERSKIHRDAIYWGFMLRVGKSLVRYSSKKKRKVFVCILITKSKHFSLCSFVRHLEKLARLRDILNPVTQGLPDKREDLVISSWMAT